MAKLSKKHWIIGSVVLIAGLIALVPPSMLRQPGVPVWRTLPPPVALPAADKSGLAPVGDIMMWYAVYNRGDGSPVLLIHGGTSNAETWGNQVPTLMRNHEVILGESRGHGAAPGPGNPTAIN